MRVHGVSNFSNIQRATDRTSLDTSLQVGLFLGCSGCHLSAEVFFLLNFFVVEGRCEVFGLQDLADRYVGVAFVGVGASLDPLVSAPLPRAPVLGAAVLFAFANLSWDFVYLWVLQPW